MTRDRVAAAADLFGFQGEIAKVIVHGHDVWITAILDIPEHVDRVRHGLGAITDRADIHALWELPYLEEYPYQAIPSWIVKRLHPMRPEVIRRTRRGLTRMVRQPMSITGALSASRRPRSAMFAVGAMSALAPMGVILDGDLRPDHQDLLDAHLYEMGVANIERGHIRVVLAPGSVEPLIGPFVWWVAELAYAELSERLKATQPMP